MSHLKSSKQLGLSTGIKKEQSMTEETKKPSLTDNLRAKEKQKFIDRERARRNILSPNIELDRPAKRPVIQVRPGDLSKKLSESPTKVDEAHQE